MTEILYFLIGIIVGAMNAVAGGGMLIGFPALVALGVPPLVANATTCIVTSPGQLASAWGYRAYLKKVPWRFTILFIPLFVGSFAGATILLHTSSTDFVRIVPWLVLFGVCLFAFSPLINYHLKQHLHGRHKNITPLLLITIAMFPLSFYGGYFGAGFGFIMLAFLSFANLRDIHMMNGMKNIGSTCISISAFAVLAGSGLIDWRVGIITGLGAIVGGYGAARGSQKVSSNWIRIVVIIVGLAAVVYLALQDY